MKIYIATSWKNVHALELLTSKLREAGHEVLSFVENCFNEGMAPVKGFNFEEWVHTQEADNAFLYDTNAAQFSDLVIYISNGGKDCAAELGMAFAKGVPIYALFAKNEDFGLMRKMVSQWFDRYNDLLKFIEDFKIFPKNNPYAIYGNQIPHPMHFDSAEEYLERYDNYWKWERQNKVSSNQ